MRSYFEHGPWAESGGGGGGEGWVFKKVFYGEVHPEEVQPLTLLYTIFNRKGTPFVYLLLTNGTPFSYSGTSSFWTSLFKGHLHSRDTKLGPGKPFT